MTGNATIRASRTSARATATSCFGEGGRYDGREATDCADLLLQGLIAWRRDTAVAEVPAEPETSTVAESQQQQPITLPESVTAESICTDNPERQPCWMELDSLPDCYVWNPRPHVLEIDTWSGQCSNGFGTGNGVFFGVNQEGLTFELPYVNGVLHGTEVVRSVDGDVEETPYVNGARHGTSITRWVDGTVRETPYVNGVEHGTSFTRYADGRVGQEPFVNGLVHGKHVWYWVDLRVETPLRKRRGTRHADNATRP